MIFYSALHAWWLTRLQLIVMLTSLFACQWQRFKTSWKFIGKYCKRKSNLDSFFYCRHRVLAGFTRRARFFGKFIENPHICLALLLSFLCFICLCAFACNIVELMGELELIHQRQIVFHLYENQLGQVCGCYTLEPDLNPLVTNCFATYRSDAIIHQILIFVDCLCCLIWNWSFYKPMLFFSLSFYGRVVRLCFLSVAIPDMHVSLL
jgi:hypothetical protein